MRADYHDQWRGYRSGPPKTDPRGPHHHANTHVSGAARRLRGLLGWD